MNCENCQDWLAGGELAAQSEAEAHVADCAACQAWRDALDSLDAEFTAAALQAKLPPGFTERLLARTIPPRQPLPSEARAVRRAELEREYQAIRAASRPWRAFREPRTLLRLLVVAGATAAAALIIGASLPFLSAGLAAMAASRAMLVALAAMGLAGFGIAGMALALRGEEGPLAFISRCLDARWVAGGRVEA